MHVRLSMLLFKKLIKLDSLQLSPVLFFGAFTGHSEAHRHWAYTRLLLQLAVR
jgi:hypothetical protein